MTPFLQLAIELVVILLAARAAGYISTRLGQHGLMPGPNLQGARFTPQPHLVSSGELSRRNFLNHSADSKLGSSTRAIPETNNFPETLKSGLKICNRSASTISTIGAWLAG